MTLHTPTHPYTHTQIWLLQLAAADLSALEPLLSADEIARADRFHFPKDRAEYVAARGTLRRILGHALDQDPAALHFTYSRHGKPALEAAGDLRFNVSHSGEYALIALSQGRDVGVDIERLRADLASMEIAQRFFSAAEVAALEALPEAQRLAGFFACWTRKEAYIKARGEGLSHQLDCFDVTLTPGETAALLATRPDPKEAAKWSLRNLPLPAGYAGALAVRGPLNEVSIHTVSPDEG